MPHEISTNEWDSGSLDACIVAGFAADTPSHARGVMRDSYPAFAVYNDHAAVSVQSRMKVGDRIACGVLRRVARSHAVRGPLCEDQLHDRLAPTGARNGGGLIVRITSA